MRICFSLVRGHGPRAFGVVVVVVAGGALW